MWITVDAWLEYNDKLARELIDLGIELNCTQEDLLQDRLNGQTDLTELCMKVTAEDIINLRRHYDVMVIERKGKDYIFLDKKGKGFSFR